MGKSWGPVGLEGFWIAVTVVAHVYLKYKFQPLFDIVPISGIHEARGEAGLYPRDQGTKEIKHVGQNFVSENESNGYTAENAAPTATGAATGGYTDASGAAGTSKDSKDLNNNADTPVGDVDNLTLDTPYHNKNITNDSNSSRNETVIANEGSGINKGGSYSNDLTDANQEKRDINNETDLNRVEQQAKEKPVDVIKRFLNPKEGYSFSLIRSQLPSIFNLSPNYTTEYLDGAYQNPATTDEEPHIWIPRDPTGISQYQIAKTGGKVDVSDEHTEYNEKGSYEVTGPPPYYDQGVKA